MAAALALASAELTFPIVSPGRPLPPDAAREAIREDAAILAARFVRAKGGAAAREVALPPNLVDSLYNAIASVHALRDSTRDDIVKRYRIRAKQSPSTHEVVITLRGRPPWSEAWRRGETVTGDTSVDAILRAHELRLADFMPWPALDSAMAVLRSEAPVNAVALAARFEGISGVKSATGNSSLGDGRDVQAHAESDGWRLDFSVGWGDCPAGCIHRHTWTFRVSTTGRAALLGESGEGPPSGDDLRYDGGRPMRQVPDISPLRQ